MTLKLFMLKSEAGYYRRRNKWTTDPQEATVWTTKAGAVASKGHCRPRPADMKVVEFEAELPITSEVLQPA